MSLWIDGLFPFLEFGQRRSFLETMRQRVNRAYAERIPRFPVWLCNETPAYSHGFATRPAGAGLHVESQERSQPGAISMSCGLILPSHLTFAVVGQGADTDRLTIGTVAVNQCMVFQQSRYIIGLREDIQPSSQARTGFQTWCLAMTRETPGQTALIWGAKMARRACRDAWIIPRHDAGACHLVSRQAAGYVYL